MGTYLSIMINGIMAEVNYHYDSKLQSKLSQLNWDFLFMRFPFTSYKITKFRPKFSRFNTVLC